jgi:hypothetical protein
MSRRSSRRFARAALASACLATACGGGGHHSGVGPSGGGGGGGTAFVPNFAAADVRLDSDPVGAAASHLVDSACDGPNVYVVWQDARNGAYDVFFNRSLDGGATWLAADVRLDTDAPGAAASFVPRVAVAGANVYVVWADARNGALDVFCNRSVDQGATWLAADLRLDKDQPGAAVSSMPQVAASGANVVVAWADQRNGANFDVYSNHSIDAGATWSNADARVDTDPPANGSSDNVRVACEGQDAYVVWEDRRSGKSDVRFNRSADAGALWGAGDVRLDTDSAGVADSLLPRIAAVGSTVAVVWHDFRNGAPDVYANRSPDGGVSWLAADVRLDSGVPGSASSTGVALAMDGQKVYVAWEDVRDGAPEIWFNRSLDGGATWFSSDVRVDTGPGGTGPATMPAVAAGDGNVYVAWFDQKTVFPQVRFNHSVDAGGTWGAFDLRIDRGNPAGVASGPSMCASGRRVYVAWSDVRAGAQNDVWFNASNP